MSESLALTRTNVSNHLACLRGCGIVVATPEGRQTRYEIADPHVTKAITILVNTVLAVLLASLPTIFIFLILQRAFAQGITGAIK